jgi:F-type H+-transporting ATPase subunit a
MAAKLLKHILVAVLGLFSLLFSYSATAQEATPETATENHAPEAEKLDPAKIIMDHIKDNHEFHFFTIENEKNPHESFHATIPLPILLYSEEHGVAFFSSSRFGHEGEEQVVDGLYKYDENKDIVTTDGSVVYDFSLTKNVVQMIIALTLLVVLMTGIAKKYKNGYGVTTAPKGWQNAVEPVITFVRDEVAKPNLKHKWSKYLPYLLTVFFFILINNLFGLLPGSANVTGNIAFTLVLGLVSLVVILFSSNKHFWGHILNPPGVPLPIKFLLVPIEIMSLFIKPIALAIRLFANILAGHIIILSIISLIFIFSKMGQNPAAGYGFSIVSLAFSIFMFFLELMVAAIQAFIFTNLTAVFIGQAIEDGHGHEEHDHHHEEATA